MRAINVDSKWPDAHYGLALCALKLKLNAEAVEHIHNAMVWGIEEFQEKVAKRKIRA